jgi:zinc transport system ATP-binding protein
VKNFSGGMKRRLEIARGLVHHPKVLFLDEPTVGIDLQAQAKFYELLHQLNSNLGLTLVLVSHDVDVIANEATEVACINKSLVYHGSPESFIKDDHLKALYGKDLKFIFHRH